MFAYPAQIEPGDDDGIFVVTFPDVPEAITEGDGERHAREQAGEALGLALLAYVRSGIPLPEPRGEGILVAPPADMSAKLAVIATFVQSGMTQTEFARRLGKNEKQVRRILDPMHGTDIGTLEMALASMGKRLVISVEAA